LALLAVFIVPNLAVFHLEDSNTAKGASQFPAIESLLIQ
jgi:hypothetical protein